MPFSKTLALAAMAAGLCWLGVTSSVKAQGNSFHTRLSAVAATAKQLPDVAGRGSVEATLSGNRLTINGKFEGLSGPATEARLHSGIGTGVRGNAFQDLTITNAASGSISGTVELTEAQVTALREGRVYVQMHSQKAPEGALWGWLLR